MAYDVTGGGPALFLLHGAGWHRQRWHERGYVERLAGEFRVVTMDMRGSGESDRCSEAADFEIGKLCADVLAVADACGAERFAVWGFSLGGNIGRYLAAWSERVTCLVIGGIAFGASLSVQTKAWARKEEARWLPILAAYKAGGELPPLADDERAELVSGHVARSIALFRAMPDWPDMGPGELRCPALVVVGTENTVTMGRLAGQRAEIDAAGVRVAELDGLNHGSEFTEMDRALAVAAPFFREFAG